MCCRAVHLPLGEAAALTAIERWLAAYEVDVTTCRDVYDLCAQLARQVDAPPDMVWIGTDWLRPDDLRIFDFVRTAWPRTVIMAYGAGCDEVPDDPADLLLVFGNHRALTAALLESPATLVDRQLRRGVRLTAASRRPSLAALRQTPLEQPATRSRTSVDEASSERGPRLDQPPAQWTRLLDESEL